MAQHDRDKNQPTGDVEAYVSAIEAGDYTSAIPLLLDAAKREDAGAMGILATCYAMGYGVEKDPVEGALWFRQAAVRGHAPSQAAFGLCLANGIGADVDIKEAAYWLYQAAKTGHAKAAIGLGNLLFADQSLLKLGLFSAAEVNRLVLDARRVVPVKNVSKVH